MNVQHALRNVVVLLQADPLNYRKFGIWWWPIKALLRRLYTQNELPFLGAYVDPDVAGRVPQLPLVETLQAAFAEYQQNDRFNLGRGVVEDSDGEPCLIYDADVSM